MRRLAIHGEEFCHGSDSFAVSQNNHEEVRDSGRAPRALAGSPDPEQARRNVNNLLGSPTLGVNYLQELINRSPVAIPEDAVEQLRLFTKRFSRRGTFYNVVFCDGPRLLFPGVFLSRLEFGWKGFPAVALSEPGGFVRVNPVREVCSGTNGTALDADVTHFDHVLIESDVLPIETQARMLMYLLDQGMPIISAVHTGGKSIHALVQLGADSAEEFRSEARDLFRSLRPFGFDMSVGNPSRMTRLPGCRRILPDGREVAQRLLYFTKLP